jgi:hypothetical protein
MKSAKSVSVLGVNISFYNAKYLLKTAFYWKILLLLKYKSIYNGK